MPELVGDIKKIDDEKIKEGREVLLKYLAEVDQITDSKAKPPEKKDMDSLVVKKVEQTPSPVPTVPVKPVEAKIDFVKDFKTAESKLKKPIIEIIHQVMDKTAPVETVRPTRPVISVETEKKPPQESRIDKSTAERRTERRISPIISTLVVNKIIVPPLKKINRKKPEKKEKTMSKRLKVQAKAALDLLGKIIFKTLSAIAAGAIIYFVFCLSLYTFGFDNRLTRFITLIFPVPAFITQYGTVNYYQYLDEKIAFINEQKGDENTLTEVLASISSRDRLIKRLILSDIAKNYGLSIKSNKSSDTESVLVNKLALLVVSDPEFNKDNLRKLRSVKSLLLGGADFTLAAASFGLQAKTEYFSTEQVIKKFGQKASDFAAISTVETAIMKEGYYIYKFNDEQDGLRGYKYIFVPATTLEMLVTDKFKETNLIILAN